MGILKRNRVLKGLRYTLVCMNRLPAFLKSFALEKVKRVTNPYQQAPSLHFLCHLPCKYSWELPSTYWGIAVSTVLSCGEAWWRKYWSKLPALWVIVMNDKADVSYAWTFHDLGLQDGYREILLQHGTQSCSGHISPKSSSWRHSFFP